MEGQPHKLVVVQFESDQFPELAELSGKALQSVLAEVQVLQCLLQCGQTEGFAEAIQLVVVEDQLRQAAKVTDGGWQLLDVVIT